MYSLDNRRGLIIGIANEHSIAYGCAQAFRAAGAQLAVTYLNSKAEPHVRPLAQALGSDIIMPCDMREPGQLDAVFQEIGSRWGRLDFVLHSIAFAPLDDLHARVTDCTREGFAMAMDISCHSFIRCAKLAEPLMKDGGSLLTISFYGAQKAVEHYNLMGPVKAALESTVRYLAAELGPRRIRVNAISAGPLATRAASGIDHFDALMDRARASAPEHSLVTQSDIGALASFLVSDGARAMTGNTEYIDGGLHAVF